MIKDVMHYFNEMQKDYNKTVKIAEKVNKEIEEGLVTEEQRNNFETYFNAVKANYDRVSYIMHLLSLPPKFIQKLQDKRIKKQVEKQIKEFEKNNATLKNIKDENENAINAANELASTISSEGD